MNQIPFIRFLWADEKGERKIYDADFPEQFIRDFTNITVTEIGGFFVLGTLQKVICLEDAFKICKG